MAQIPPRLHGPALPASIDETLALLPKHGKPVARLVGARTIDNERVNEAFEKLKALRKGTTLGGLSWKRLRDEGRP